MCVCACLVELRQSNQFVFNIETRVAYTLLGVKSAMKCTLHKQLTNEVHLHYKVASLPTDSLSHQIAFCMPKRKQCNNIILFSSFRRSFENSFVLPLYCHNVGVQYMKMVWHRFWLEHKTVTNKDTGKLILCADGI